MHEISFNVKLLEMYEMVKRICTSFLSCFSTRRYFEFVEMCTIMDPLQNELKYPYILL